MKIVKSADLQAIIDKGFERYKETHTIHWLKSREMAKKYSILFSLSVSLLFVLLQIIVTHRGALELGDTFWDFNSVSGVFSLVVFVIIVQLAIMPAHECIHYLFYPFKSKANVCMSYTYGNQDTFFYDGLLTKKRYLVILAAPFVLINSTVIVLIFFIADTISLLIAIHLSTLVSYWDIIRFFDVLCNVPRDVHMYAGQFIKLKQ